MKRSTRVFLIIRRVHLYTGLFLLPWVILYGVTGAMFNHVGLFPRLHTQPVDTAVLAESGFEAFPTAEQLAAQVLQAIQNRAGSASIRLADTPGAEYTGDLMFEVRRDGHQHVVHLDPVSHVSWIGTMPKNEEEPELLLPDIRSITLSPDPHELARSTAARVLDETRLLNGQHPQPLGFTKLNFLADVDGQPARITYVLRDGHVDINRFTGDDGIPLRQFVLRLHTIHGQSPTWNGRMFWSVAVDTMAIAMVFWGTSGLIMWWQIRRTRLTGAVVIGLSLVTATLMFLGVHSFLATTRL